MEAWAAAAKRLLGKPARSRRAPVVAVLALVDHQMIESRFGRRGVGQVLASVAQVVISELEGHEQVGLDGHGRLCLILRGTADPQVQRRLTGLVTRLSRVRVRLGAEELHVTVSCGWTSAADHPPSTDPMALLARAVDAADLAAEQLDLVPRRWVTGTKRSLPTVLPPTLRTVLQALATVAIGLVLPFAAMVVLYRHGIDVATPAYLLVTAALVITAGLIWTEGINALKPKRPPHRPAAPYPPASAIIPAYLPNEAATIVDTLMAFLAIEYPGGLQVVLAYNTPKPMPIERELHALAARHPRLTVMKVPFSTSKAQNVNAALQVVNGEFTGVYDADHHPSPDTFTRAWKWISHGADVVQGHCVVRNGNASWVARTVAVEFESIYGVSHPGRAKLHGFGIFGGANGFWRTSVLHEVRMHASMLTEDIDCSMRALLSGRKIINDPAMVSRELAPAKLSALWHQRIRWAQGWFQVSRKHLLGALRSPHLSVRNKFGAFFLLGWREIYPWLSLQMLPIVAFLAWKAGGVSKLDWIIPTFLLTTLYTLSVGPSQVLFAWRLAAPDVRRHKRWFWAYLFVSIVFYTEFKNLIARVAQLKELTGERKWVVTPRESAVAAAGER